MFAFAGKLHSFTDCAPKLMSFISKVITTSAKRGMIGSRYSGLHKDNNLVWY